MNYIEKMNIVKDLEDQIKTLQDLIIQDYEKVVKHNFNHIVCSNIYDSLYETNMIINNLIAIENRIKNLQTIDD